MLQQETPDDYVIATGFQYSVRDFVEAVAKKLSLSLSWNGKGVDEYAVDSQSGRVIIRVDHEYFRPAEVETLLGNSDKASKNLGWTPKISFQEMVDEMVSSDYLLAEIEKTQSKRIKVIPRNA